MDATTAHSYGTGHRPIGRQRRLGLACRSQGATELQLTWSAFPGRARGGLESHSGGPESPARSPCHSWGNGIRTKPPWFEKSEIPAKNGLQKLCLTNSRGFAQLPPRGPAVRVLIELADVDLATDRGDACRREAPKELWPGYLPKLCSLAVSAGNRGGKGSKAGD